MVIRPISPAGGCEIFGWDLNKKPKEDTILKVQKACQYLLFTDLRIKEIANKLGIEDQYYFSRMFTKIMGMSPVAYRIKRIN